MPLKQISNFSIIQRIEFANYEVIKRLNYNDHEALKLIAKIFKLKIGARGNIVTIEGDNINAKLCVNLLKHLEKIINDNQYISLDDIRDISNKILEEPKQKINDLLGESLLKNKHQKDITPKGDAQKKYVEAISNYDLVFGVGPAGSGKTYLAMAMALVFLNNKKINRIILTRPAVEAGEKLGFLPGNMEEKVLPYLTPLYDALFDFIGKEKAEALISSSTIEIAPLAFMRGRTLSNAFIIVDEAQNTTVEQMKMVLTRLGFGSKMVITGDMTQIDLPTKQKSGLIDALSKLKSINDIKICHLSEKDILRHPIVKLIVLAYNKNIKE